MKEIDMDRAVELGSPYPYTLLVTLDSFGNVNAMGLSWWTFTSAQPPMLAICVGHDRFTHECLQSSKEFALCFPSEEIARAAWRCGSSSGRMINKINEVGLSTLPAKEIRPPLIEGSTVAYECRLLSKLKCGDSTLYNANIVAAHGNEEIARHLYTIHYRKLVSLDSSGGVNLDLDYE